MGKVRSWTQETKFLHTFGYLFELVYDLALDPHHRVSANPGWETPLGAW